MAAASSEARGAAMPGGRLRDQQHRFWAMRMGRHFGVSDGHPGDGLANVRADAQCVGPWAHRACTVHPCTAGQPSGRELADRMHRGRIVTLCLALQGIGACVLLGASLQDAMSRELVLAVAALIGLARGFQMPAQQAWYRCWCLRHCCHVLWR